MKKLYFTLFLLVASTLASASDVLNYKSYDKELNDALMNFVQSSKDIAGNTTYTPRYIVKHHERVNLITSYQQLAQVIHKYDNEIKELKRHIRKKHYAQALNIISIKALKYKYLAMSVNYMMMSGDNFIAVFSDDFEDINYDSKNFEKDFRQVRLQSYRSNSRVHAPGKNGSGQYPNYHLNTLSRPTMQDLENLEYEVTRLAKNEEQMAIVQDIKETIEEYNTEVSSYKALLKTTDWNAGRYTIFYAIKEFILKSFSYVAIPMNHAIKEEQLKKVAESEFLPGDIGAIQRYGKLSNLVFKGNWTHGLMYIGKYSKFKEYFSADTETNELFAKKCIEQELECHDYITYLTAKFPKDMKTYRQSEEKGRPYVTLEGLKPGVVFMELGPSMAWDNLAILRPNLSIKDKALALERTFSSIGKKYDYSFNGNSYSRFVCTELIQYSYEENPYENKNGIEWDVNIVMGRPAMYGFDLVQTFINQEENPDRKKQLSLVIYMKGIKKKDRTQLSMPAEFVTAKRGSIKELKDTL